MIMFLLFKHDLFNKGLSGIESCADCTRNLHLNVDKKVVSIKYL